MLRDQTRTPSPAVWKRARELAAAERSWPRVISVTPPRGLEPRPFYVIPASDNAARVRRGLPARAHWTAKDGSGCTCPKFNAPGRSGGWCSHTLAAEILFDELEDRRIKARRAQKQTRAEQTSAQLESEDAAASTVVMEMMSRRII